MGRGRHRRIALLGDEHQVELSTPRGLKRVLLAHHAQLRRAGSSGRSVRRTAQPLITVLLGCLAGPGFGAWAHEFVALARHVDEHTDLGEVADVLVDRRYSCSIGPRPRPRPPAHAHTPSHPARRCWATTAAAGQCGAAQVAWPCLGPGNRRCCPAGRARAGRAGMPTSPLASRSSQLDRPQTSRGGQSSGRPAHRHSK